MATHNECSSFQFLFAKEEGVSEEEDPEEAKSTKKHEKILYNPITLHFYNVQPQPFAAEHY
jgi:hypothetical protein